MSEEFIRKPSDKLTTNGILESVKMTSPPTSDRQSNISHLVLAIDPDSHHGALSTECHDEVKCSVHCSFVVPIPTQPDNRLVVLQHSTSALLFHFKSL